MIKYMTHDINVSERPKLIYQITKTIQRMGSDDWAYSGHFEWYDAQGVRYIRLLFSHWPAIYNDQEPVIHSHITDNLPEIHPLADSHIHCSAPGCLELLHAGNNECMQTWLETPYGNFCTKCFPITNVLSYEGRR